MKAFVYYGPNDMRMQDVPAPKIEHESDAIVKVDRSTLCGTDIQIMRGALREVVPGTILGHEFCGTVVETGPAVKTVKAGQRVAASSITACGYCNSCKKGMASHCENGGWMLGYSIDGCQAEYVRVPYADNGLSAIPDSVSFDAALFCGDILSAGYFGAEKARIEPGDTVVVIGAGPVGICAMISAKIFGPARIIALDVNDKRLGIIREQNLADIVINPSAVNASEAVMELTGGVGADAVIEAAGVRQSFEFAVSLSRPNGRISIVALYSEPLIYDLKTVGERYISMRTGNADNKHMFRLLELIAAKRIDTGVLITHSAPLNNIMKGYEIFGNRTQDCLKWIVTPYENDNKPRKGF